MLLTIAAAFTIPKLLQDYYARLREGAYVEFSAQALAPTPDRGREYRLWIDGNRFKLEKAGPDAGDKFSPAETAVSDGERRLTINHSNRIYFFGTPSGVRRPKNWRPDESLFASSDDRNAALAYTTSDRFPLQGNWQVNGEKVTLLPGEVDKLQREWTFENGSLKSFVCSADLGAPFSEQVTIHRLDWGKPPAGTFALTVPAGYREFIPM